jgi:hypothetical protein
MSGIVTPTLLVAKRSDGHIKKVRSISANREVRANNRRGIPCPK